MSASSSLAAVRRVARTPGFVVAAATVGAVCLAALGGRSLGGWVMDRIVDLTFDDVPRIGTAEVAARLDGPRPPLLLDVRAADEFAASHLPGARHLPPDADPAAALADVPRDRPIVLYCSVGWRSAAMARRLIAAGFERPANMQGSLFRWAAEDRPLVDGAGAPTGRVHPYGPPWSWLVAPEDRAEEAP